MDISELEFEKAKLRGAARQAAFPPVTAVKYDRRIGRIVISLASGLQLAFAPRDAQGFENARPVDLFDAEISPSGLGVHFPKLDADVYVPALLDGFLGSKRWMASQAGKRGGAMSSEAKSAAARTNGKLGGRPRKVREPT
ncbi:DUF2442 domain-containing protein [Massilia cavernae]|uniref:DUF2442 domain-containing protein n=1 Tax=Massilia cavernae TaxID=2320864 RepID=A0A418Y6M4_9BURK|nr:DUF2442 domain-containing protein [Massilia cavernae]RJG23862.1 DUF2442 domain-containing protein [Massilia cavernae]